ncbi:MAG: hypothetical protein J0L70_27140 [Leptolyngbya sp. UWPOB_LEPTO1]|uniref:hypothetical protein n=1 Tax=Leptolyngbya sp. UWPOB_LEPTO1 TaxID=2815653 RepID=UPI001AC4EAAB|nr:hypothetical protein [Leptolyngbya sp. UWPOB_LEPTO1]MBN8564213.1 hypothetical protein [Leptolyngbya sp. UWPOB_LEPTO1]
MQQKPFAETLQELPESTRLEHGQYTMLLQQEMSAVTEGSIYFSLPDQDGYLFEYDGDLDEALNDLPEIHGAIASRDEVQQSPTLTPEATIVIEQLWNHFEQTGTQELEGGRDYNFRIESDWLLVVPKEPSEEVVAISRDGEVQSTFEPERYEHLMARCAIAYENSIDPAYEQTQVQQFQQNKEQNWELG